MPRTVASDNLFVRSTSLRLDSPCRGQWLAGALLLALSAACATNQGQQPTFRAAPPARKAAPSATGVTPMTAQQGQQPSQANKPKTKREAAELRDYQQAFALYSQGAYDAAIQALSTYEKRYPLGAHPTATEMHYLAQARNLRGLAELMSKRPAVAAQQFKSAIQTNDASDAAFTQYVLYNLATAQLEAGDTDGAEQSLGEIRLEQLDRDNQIKVHFLRGRVLLRKNQPIESARETLEAVRLLGDAQPKEAMAPFASQLAEALGAQTALAPGSSQTPTLGAAAIEDIYRDYETSPLADQILYRLGAREMSDGNAGKAEEHLRALMARFPQSQYYAQAQQLIDSLATQSKADPNVVGVLLPLRGKFASFGMRSLHGVEMAFRVFNAQEPDAKITLVIEDSGEDAETAVKALDRLVYKDHAIAVIGPLLSKGIDQITSRAQEIGVPLISLARYTGVQSDYIFQAGLTLKLQASEIARYAIERLNMKRFAILYPSDKVGQEISQDFWDAVEGYGGEITGVESYNAGETDFRQAVDKLSGTYYSEARTRETDALAQEREENNIKKKTRRTEKFFDLPPIVDYDAVFIPDEPKVAGQIIPMFAYRDVDGMRFLGTSAWNSKDFVATGASTQNSIFVDVFFPESRSSAVQKFIDKYHATFGAGVDPIGVDAVAYDAGRLVEHALKDAGSSPSRSDVRQKLHEISGFKGVTGNITFKDGTFARDLRLLTVREGRVVELEGLQ